jgi:hypothetical protein
MFSASKAPTSHILNVVGQVKNKTFKYENSKP